MKVRIQDEKALAAVSPAALSAHARAYGWTKVESYGRHSDVYTREGAPEIIVPRTQRLGDYASVVSQLVEIFAEVADTDTLSLYRMLTIADRDVVRVTAATEGGDGSVALNDGVKMITGARDMALAAACSLHEPRPAYRAAANREASEYLRRVHLGQTEQGSFVVTLLSPVVAPPVQTEDLFGRTADDQPIERRMTQRLVEALAATREAAEKASVGDADAFGDAVSRGASANLCDALAMLIEPFHGIDVTLAWARTRPMKAAREAVRFGASHAPVLREAARCFREHEPRMDEALVGRIQRLQRSDGQSDGAVALRTWIDGRVRSVSAVLNRRDYDRAIQAHKDNAPVVMFGDLERFRNRWRLRNPRVVDIISDEEDASGDCER